MRTRGILRIFAMAWVTIGSLSGCAEAPAPFIPAPGPVVSFTRPESTLATLARAVRNRDSQVFGLCLADTLLELREFHASFDPDDIRQVEASGRTPPADWTRDNEIAFFPRFMALNPSVFYDCSFSIESGPGGIVDLGGPTRRKLYNLRYRVWAAGDAVAAGSAGITFEGVGVSGETKITHWADHRDTIGVRTWGMARLDGP